MYEPIDLKDFHLKEPPQYKVGDKIDGNEIIEIRGTVNGKCTYATGFVCKNERPSVFIFPPPGKEELEFAKKIKEAFE